MQYNDSSSIAKIKELTNNALSYGFDAISASDAQKFSVQTFGTGGGKLVIILGKDDGAQALRPDVAIQRMFRSNIFSVTTIFMHGFIATIIYTSLGRSFSSYGTSYPASPEDRAHMADFLKKVPELVKSGQVKGNPTKLLEGGLEGVPAGFQLMKEGKNSGEKLVYRVAN